MTISPKILSTAALRCLVVWIHLSRLLPKRARRQDGRFQTDGRQYKDLRRDWMLGSEEFRQELLEQTGKWLGPNGWMRQAAWKLARTSG
jgi:hypothetical protein